MPIYTMPRRKCSELPSGNPRTTDPQLLKALLADTAQLVGTAIVLRDNAVGLQSRLCRGTYTTSREVKHTLRAAATVVAAIRVSRTSNTTALRAADDLVSFIRGEPLTPAIAQLVSGVPS